MTKSFGPLVLAWKRASDAPPRSAALLFLFILLAACTAESTGGEGADSGSALRGLAAEAARDAREADAVSLTALTATETPARPPSEPELLVLARPSLDDWRPRLGPVEVPPLGPGRLDDSANRVVVAVGYDAPVFKAPGQRGILGRVRRGNRLRARATQGRGCSGGRWYRLLDEPGFVCSEAGFQVLSTESAERRISQRQPDPTRPLPLDHAEVKVEGAPRLSRLPSAEEAELLDEVVRGELDYKGLGELVVQRMVGDYFLAIDQEVSSGGRRYYRTVKGHFVRVEDVELLEVPRMRGEHLGEELDLPIAFVHVEKTPLFCEEAGGVEPCGQAERHARFAVERIFEDDGERWVESEGGFLAPRSSVRIARSIEAPSRIPGRAKWAHIDLEEQTLVAYEGSNPVFATLVTTGTEGYTTPAGLWRTNRKYITRTMSGGNEVKGFYDVEEVPWTMYYNRGWAVHGAYWHDEFGNVRSHGCTNLAPADARWVFYWSSLKVPEGWQGVTGRQGTWWYFTRS